MGAGGKGASGGAVIRVGELGARVSGWAAGGSWHGGRCGPCASGLGSLVHGRDGRPMRRGESTANRHTLFGVTFGINRNTPANTHG